VEFNHTRICELLVGLPEVNVIGAEEQANGGLVVLIESVLHGGIVCGCGWLLSVKERPIVRLVDLPVFGRPTRLWWRKHRLVCGARCGAPSHMWTDDRIAYARHAMTTRAGRWATRQVGEYGRTVAEVARELGCDWHTVNDMVIAFGTPLVDDSARIGTVTALGVDEILFVKRGEYRKQVWATQLVDVRAGQVIDVVEGRDIASVGAWFTKQPKKWCEQITYATLDLSGTYRAMLDRYVGHAIQIADPFHVVRVANTALDDCRRRVQNETLGHRGRTDDPLYRSRRRLQMASERLTVDGETKLLGLLKAGDPRGHVKETWHAKETVRGIYHHTDTELATEWVDDIIRDFADKDLPIEVRRLGRTIKKWRNQILAWHPTRLTNGPTEAANNLAKRIKRVAFGFRRFDHFRIRTLLYTGKPNWDLLDTINPA
jgi:transposase